MTNKIIDMKREDFYDKNKELFNVIAKMNRLISENNYNKTKYACVEGMKFIKNYVEVVLRKGNTKFLLNSNISMEFYKYNLERLENILNKLDNRLREYDYNKEIVEELFGIGISNLILFLRSDFSQEMIVIEKDSLVTKEESVLKEIEKIIKEMLECLFLINIKIENKGDFEEFKDDSVYYGIECKDCEKEDIIIFMIGGRKKVFLQIIKAFFKDSEIKNLDRVLISAIEEFAKVVSIRCINYINNVNRCNYNIIDTCLISCSEIYTEIGCKQCKAYITFKTQFGEINFSISYI